MIQPGSYNLIIPLIYLLHLPLDTKIFVWNTLYYICRNKNIHYNGHIYNVTHFSNFYFILFIYQIHIDIFVRIQNGKKLRFCLVFVNTIDWSASSSNTTSWLWNIIINVYGHSTFEQWSWLWHICVYIQRDRDE